MKLLDKLEDNVVFQFICTASTLVVAFLPLLIRG